MQPATAIDTRQLTERLAVSELTPSAAEAHGILCGLICAGHPEAETTWTEEILRGTDPGDLLAQACRQSLQALAETTREEIQGAGLGFAPLLPADDVSLAERAVGLYDWTRGFLYGLGVAGVDEKDLSEQTREIFRDFAAITQLDLEGLDEETEEGEEALMELQEFVWVAAMLVYEERGQGEELAP
jgi:uncharacterized protein YgfB (UPF0149 family)